MEKLQPFQISLSLYLFLLLQFSSLSLLSAYTVPDKYYINCGSNSIAIYGQRTFVGDASSGPLTNFSVGKGEAVSTSMPTSLYQTARVFRSPSSYEFEIAESGTHIVRLHFYAFSSQGYDLSEAQFNASASGFSLLSNFNVKTSGNSPVIREFLLNITVGKFSIFFTPQSSSFAFVSAIEAFLCPPNFLPDNATLVNASGFEGYFNGVLSNHVFHIVHRINVGGFLITEHNDTLGRNWVPDDDYLLNRDSASNFSGASFTYQDGIATRYSAPDPVYQTAKRMNRNFSQVGGNFFNITWDFNVSKNVRHFVRAHFCDIISGTVSLQTKFNLYIYGNYSTLIFPYNVSFQLAVPFYVDSVVDSDDSGIMRISVGPRNASDNDTAFLNGLEIMELISGRSSIQESITGSKNTGLIIGCVAGGMAFVVILVAVFLLGRKCRKAKPVENLDWQTIPLQGWESSSSRITERTLNLGLRLSFAEIQHATNNFDSKLIVGEGGFGKVYKGILGDGTKAAVKRSAPGYGQGLPEFQTEILVLSKIRHRHLVSLIGYCDEGSEMILVYEFMEKGTLRDHLYSWNAGSKKSSPSTELSWIQRLEISIGAAKGLHYLHTSSGTGIIHRDVKSTNILLDEFYVAKVADFGLSRLGVPDQTHVSTEVKGSFGYMDPEYFRCLQLTQKSDVYSFGVVLLEVLCARPAINRLLSHSEVSLADWGLTWQKKGQLEKIVDPSLADKINPNSLRKFGETVEKCLREYGVDRPSMHDVLWDLEYVLQLQQTTRSREPHEDSTSDVSWGMALPAVRRLPSHTILTDEDDDHEDNLTDTSQVNAGEVFSQLKIDDAR